MPRIEPEIVSIDSDLERVFLRRATASLLLNDAYATAYIVNNFNRIIFKKNFWQYLHWHKYIKY